MGKLMDDDDIFIANLFEILNLRFAPSQGPDPEFYGGIDEMVALQREFKIFREDRKLKDSIAIMNLGGFWNPRAKNRWYKLLDKLDNYESNAGKATGGAAIVAAIIENLTSSNPRPMFFKAHDSRKEGERKVLVVRGSKPVFYIDMEFITISLPMKPKTDEGP